MFGGWFGGSKEAQTPKKEVVMSVAAEGKVVPKLGKSGKKICCSCPSTKDLRDTCVVEKGESECAEFIQLHKECLRAEGFTVA
jgi:cytochrome c oxidase assembly protein subunit 17